MAYFRDDLYAFASEEADGRWFHFWMRGGYDSWDQSGWGSESTQVERDAGVGIPARWIDRFVLMRLAEMVVERTATSTLDAMARELFDRPGNVGEHCLRHHRELLRSALADLETRCSAAGPQPASVPPVASVVEGTITERTPLRTETRWLFVLLLAGLLLAVGGFFLVLCRVLPL